MSKAIKAARNRMRQKITLWVLDRPWPSFLITLASGLVIGAVVACLF